MCCRNFEKLTPHDIRGNCKLAFETAEGLGIPRVIDPADMVLLQVPDKLAVMTDLHQLRAYFTGQEMSLMQLGLSTFAYARCQSKSYICLIRM